MILLDHNKRLKNEMIELKAKFEKSSATNSRMNETESEIK